MSPGRRRACGSSASSWIRISGRIARAAAPRADIRIENFRDTQAARRLDAVIGNVPFADVKLDYRGQKLSLHDFFIAKSLDALKPGGVLALVTSHFTLDKQNAAIREYLADRGRFPGGDPPAVGRLQARRHGGRHRHRVPAQAGTRPGSPTTPTRTGWTPRPLAIEGVDVAGQPLFPATTLRWCWATGAARTRSMAASGYSVTGNGDLAEQLDAAIRRLPEGHVIQSAARTAEPARPPSSRRRPSGTSPKAVSSSATTGSSTRSKAGSAVPVTYGGTLLKADGTMTGKRLGRPDRPARPRPPRAPVAERGLAGGQPQRRPPRAEPGL